MPYVPSKAPPTTTEDGAALASYLEIELERLASSIVDDVQAVEIRPAHSAPIRPRAGMIAYADGVDWNPSYGEGLYQYSIGGSWQKLIHDNGPGPEGIELGSPSVVADSYIDFHSSGNIVDHDARIVCSGGGATTGQGFLFAVTRFFNIQYTDAGVGSNLALRGPGATTPDKFIRSMNGNFEVVNSAYGAVIATLTDAGDLSWTGTAWTDYTPTLTASSGTFTTASATGRYKVLGKVVIVHVTITVTIAGTAGYPIFTLPVGPHSDAEVAFYGNERALNGKTLNGRSSGGSLVVVTNYDNSNPSLNATIFELTGVYEAA